MRKRFVAGYTRSPRNAKVVGINYGHFSPSELSAGAICAYGTPESEKVMTQRPRSHIIETSSRNALASTLPNSWVIHPSGETHAWAALLKELIKTPPVKEHVGMFSYNLGNALLNNGQWADACVAFDSALINDPSYDNRAYFWGDYGCAKFELDNFDAALRCYEKAVSLEDTPDYRWRLGDTLFHLGQYKMAAVELEAALPKLTCNSRSYVYLVLCVCKELKSTWGLDYQQI